MTGLAWFGFGHAIEYFPGKYAWMRMRQDWNHNQHVCCTLPYRIASNRIFNISFFAHWPINDAAHITCILLFHSLWLSWNVQLKVNDLIAFCFVANVSLSIHFHQRLSLYLPLSRSGQTFSIGFPDWRITFYFDTNLDCLFFFIFSCFGHLRSCPSPQTHTQHSFYAQKVTLEWKRTSR